MQLKNYRVAMSTLCKPDEEEEWQNPSARIADDPNVHGLLGDEQGFIEELDEEENEVENLGQYRRQSTILQRMWTSCIRSGKRHISRNLLSYSAICSYSWMRKQLR